MASAESHVDIEQQILNIIASTVPNEAKKTLIEYCCKQSLELLQQDACHSVLKHAIEWIVRESDELLIDSGRMLLKTCAQNKPSALASFFTETVLLTLLKANDAEPNRILDIINCVFPYLKTSSKIYPRLCKIVCQEVTTWLTRDEIQFCGSVAMFLEENFEYLLDIQHELLRVNIRMIQCLGKTKIPNVSKDAMIEFFDKVECICKFLRTIWAKDTSQSFIMISVKECFEILSNPSYQSTVALASLTNYIPEDVINPIIGDVTVSSTITDDTILSGLSKMVQWLVWPKKTKVALWLLTFFRCLGKSGRKKVLQQLILDRILQVLSRVFMPVIRESNFVVLVNMLMNCLDSPFAFHKIIPFVPNLMDRLRKEKKEQSNHYLTALGELMFTLMYRFPDNSGVIYGPLLLALKDISKPTIEMMNKWIHSASNIGHASENSEPKTSFIFTTEMLNLVKNKSRTGLVNLGNTCYMNSILQCLFMLDVFRNHLFARPASQTRHPVLYSLQDVITFLLLSKRNAVAPENFVRHSRPPWFPARTQQDCCEFVHYLMDKLEEEDKSLLQDKVETATPATNIVEEHFKGVLCVTYECMTCGNESKHKEDFTDILLAFPEVLPVNAETPNSSNLPTQEENPKSLKGGDQVRNLQDSRYKEDSFETSKEKASNVQTKPKSSTDSPTTVKQDVRNRCTFTINEMLDYFMKPEQLTGNNQYFCDECRANVDGERRVQITKLPKFLVLSLKRFSFDVKSQTKPKLLHVVDYPEELTFCSVGESILLQSNKEDEEIAMKIDGEEDQAMDTSFSLYPYKLCSVVVHSGHTCEAGHYYSYALDTSRNGSDSKRNQWYCFNDENTYETSYKDFVERERNSVTDTTYIVIYMIDKPGMNEACEQTEAPAEMITRVEQDNRKYLLERSTRSSVQQQSKAVEGRNKEDDDSPPPGSCGSNGSSFSVPGNRFIF
ncbi:ubiquitin carboxyl-terminal hydrolase 35-like [Dendronephthya gigantea]|uniref:ubiquitin carboxyl-terminal hydrolase 35-like n=1 Tax=Dendronephthya gigantea TaxID=151771 RepID=UPI00106B78AC|nr:ubiquitin carboxyl-terminal hydrolase 35-like [Dendronephthya gigantea]